MSFLIKYGLMLSLTAVLACGAVFCSGGGGAGPESGGGSLVCGDGEAWIVVDGKSGYIFSPDGDMIAVEDLGNGFWGASKVGTYSADGGKLTVEIDGKPVTMTYSFSGDKLTLSDGGDKVVFTKRTGVKVDV